MFDCGVVIWFSIWVLCDCRLILLFFGLRDRFSVCLVCCWVVVWGCDCVWLAAFLDFGRLGVRVVFRFDGVGLYFVWVLLVVVCVFDCLYG